MICACPHQQADAGGVEFIDRQFAGDAAAAHHEDAVGQRAHFLQLDGDEQDRDARVAQCQQLRVDRLDRADVHAARRLAHQHQLRLGQHFARDDDLLLVPAGQQADAQVRVRRAHVELLQQAGATLGDALEVEQAPAALDVVLVAEEGVLHHGEVLHDAVAQPVFRHVGDAQVAEHERQAVRVVAFEWQGLAFEVGAACRRQAHAGQDLHQLALAVAGHARDRDDLAGAQREVDVVQQGDARVVLQLQAFHLQHRLARAVRRAGQVVLDRAAHHHVGQLLLRRPRRLDRADHAAGAHHRHGVGDVHDLLQLVGDQDDRLALFLEQLQDLEQRLGFLRGQHGGRLVQDQDVRAAVDLLQDLDALLHADGQVVDRRQRIDVQAVARADLAQLGFRLGAVTGQAEAAFGAEHDVVEHRHVIDQHEVLVHHADAEADRFLAGADLAHLAVQQDVAAVGLVVAVQDAHQRGLAGAVLADEAMDRTLGDREADVRIRLHGSEMLGDAAEFNSWLHRI